VVQAVHAFSAGLLLYCLPGSELEHAGMDAGLEVVREGFADRAYEPNGLLADRRLTDALLKSPEQVAQQALSLANGHVTARDGSVLNVQVRSICLHSDTPSAVACARQVHMILKEHGFTIVSPAHVRA
jgi:UPF0271 protein